MNFANIAMILGSVCLNTFAQLFLKKGANDCISGKSISFDIILLCLGNLNFWLGFLCYGVSILVWIFVLSKMSVSLAYPFLSFGFILSVFLAHFFLGEPITLSKIIGILLICTGLFVLLMNER